MLAECVRRIAAHDARLKISRVPLSSLHSPFSTPHSPLLDRVLAGISIPYFLLLRLPLYPDAPDIQCTLLRVGYDQESVHVGPCLGPLWR